MELAKEHVRRRCIEALSQAGVSAASCEFYGDAAQCEYDISQTIHQLRKELLTTKQTPHDVDSLAGTIQSMSRCFAAWKKVVDDLMSRRASTPSLQLDPRKFERQQMMKALCSVQTKEVQLKTGEDVIITDASQPNKLKVRNNKGQEGYVPTLSCILPSPDVSTLDAVDRLQLYLLMCWADCDNKVKACLRDSLKVSTSELWTKWGSRGVVGGRDWEGRISRRLKRITDTTRDELNNGIDCNRLHKTLASLENELLWARNKDLSPLIEVAANLDKAVLLYQGFRRQWRLFRQHAKDSPVRPVRIVLHWDPSMFGENKKFRYYEVKLTAEETTVREETVKADADVTQKVGTEADIVDSSQKDEALSTVGGSRTDGQRFTEATDETKYVYDISTSRESGGHRGIQPEGLFGEEGMTESGERHDGLRLAGEITTDTTTCHELQTLDPPTRFVGGARQQSVDAQQVVMSSHEENQRIFIRSVVDPRDGREISMNEALTSGVIDRVNGLYVNPLTGSSCPIATAMNDGRILVDHVTTTRTPVTTQAIGIITIRTQTDTHEYIVAGAIDAATQQKLTGDEARRRGIIDEALGCYVNTLTGDQMLLDDAIDAGLVFPEFIESDEPKSPAPCETKTYAVSSVVDQLIRRPIPFPDALRRGLIDSKTGCYVNNVTGERVFAGDAVRRGFYKCCVVDDPSSLIGIDKNNRVIVDRVDRVRKNVLREVQVVNAFKQSGER